ncbi:MAG: regulatory protein RecX [Thiolinea sp.]
MAESNSRAAAWAQAIRLLSQREHSRHELAGKLCRQHALDESVLDDLLDELEQSGYLDDGRYAEMLVRSSVGRGHGPMKITYALRDKGIRSELATAVLAKADPDWYALAAWQREKKFGEDLPRDPKEIARQQRFLAGRGFFIATINAVLHEKC